MSISHWTIVAALALPPLAVTAQQTQQPLDPADANAPVQASGYVSACKDYRATADEKTSPDKVWRAANEQVQREGEQGGSMKDAGPGNASPAANAPISPGPQSTQGQAAPKADPHAGHDGHHSKGK